MANGSTADKARKARNKANEQFGGVSTYDTEKIVKNVAKNAGAKLRPSEVTRATSLMQTRRQNDRDRTAARATFIAGPNSPASKRAAASRMAATTGAPMKQAPKATVTKKSASVAKPAVRKVALRPAAKKSK